MKRLIHIACCVGLAGCSHRLPPISPTPSVSLDLTPPARTSDDRVAPAMRTISSYDEPIPISAPVVTMISTGEGHTTSLTITGDLGAPAPIDLALDIATTQGGRERSWPGIVMHAQAEASALPGAIGYRLLVSRIDLRDAPDRAWPALHDGVLTRLAGLSIDGEVRTNGSLARLALHRDDTEGATGQLIHELVVPGLLPMWPVLPDEPIAPGAIWQVTFPSPPSRDLAYMETITYVLVAASGDHWEISGTIAISGPDQDIDGTHVAGVTGTGTFAFSSSPLRDVFPSGRTDLVLQLDAARPIELHISNELSRPR